ncbi:MAG TPA: BadF/BadG/BcrA/BcrD ATPase family protein [Candidatus Acidoferrales bacterium]|jgi:N-acetylglucosamine kinase-like BadF-type ATPase|nr:BadF/BadG/BcrA/BcrD ATPase family protein [Candidatus Acidoferrales bacterium]
MYNLGIDQGGTKTVAIVADDDGRILGRGFGAGACHFFDGLPKAMAAVETAVQQALTQAGLALGDLRAVSAGMAGANWPEEIAALETGLRKLLSVTDVRVCNDCVIALRGGTASPRCAVICAGTGLNVAARLTAAPVFVYNNYIEDMDQGARALGARALQAIFLSEIGALPSTTLTETALAFFGLDRVERLLLAYQRQQLSKPVQAFSPLLFAAAEKSDRVALDILYQFALSISRYPIAAIQKHGAHQAEIDIVLSGGLFKVKGTLLAETIATEIHRVAPAARVLEAEYEPVVGAILQLLDTTYHGAIPPAVMQNCRASAEKLDLLRIKSK